tara:strand:- start:187 stop:570 length:384 start_codon:yes stop_codon:yes gene_type:complete
MSEEDLEWCYYSDMPSPNAYKTKKMSKKIEYRGVGDEEFQITEQVMYDVVYMSCPEFVNYYEATQGFTPIPNIRSIIEEIWYDLKEVAIRDGINKSLRTSSLTEYYKTTPKPPEPLGKKRGRPKKSI